MADSPYPPHDDASISVHLSYIRKGIDDINDHLDRLNGRTRTNEIDIGILKDRQSDTRKTSGAFGAGGGFLGGILAGFVQSWLSGK